jgi:hypothetical protein
MSKLRISTCLLAVLIAVWAPQRGESDDSHSVARQWNEAALEAIRNDWARPVVHARNLYHLSAAMWDAWAAYEPRADGVSVNEFLGATDRVAAREEAISFAAYRLLYWRFLNSPGAEETLPALDQLMDSLGYDRNDRSTAGNSPSALGNRIALAIIEQGLKDGSNEQGDYANLWYEPSNFPLQPDRPGNPFISDPNRWQPLTLEIFMDQAGRITDTGTPEFLGPEWGAVHPFALQTSDLTVYERNDYIYRVFHDPGPPPLIGSARDGEYKAGFEQVAIWSGYLPRIQSRHGATVRAAAGACRRLLPGTGRILGGWSGLRNATGALVHDRKYRDGPPGTGQKTGRWRRNSGRSRVGRETLPRPRRGHARRGNRRLGRQRLV